MRRRFLAVCTAAAIVSAAGAAVAGVPRPPHHSGEQRAAKPGKGAHAPDHAAAVRGTRFRHDRGVVHPEQAVMSGVVQHGGASVYSPGLVGQPTASGRRFRPTEHVAASKSLPLGSTARVTNLRTGRSAVVEVVDRGPYVRGRIIDLSPAAASALGMDRHGIAYVMVEPVPAR